MNNNLYSERDLVIPALEVIRENDKMLSTTDLIKKLQEKLKPTGKDVEILFGRSDTRFSQKVRNLISHKTILEYVDYDKDKAILTLNKFGEMYLNKHTGMDTDTVDFEGDKLSEEMPIPEGDIGKEMVQVEVINSSVFELKRKNDRIKGEINPKNGLILNESFQRTGLVWSPAQKSKLIESILLKIPLPNFYLAEDKNNNLVVIDGRQRLTALFEFLDDKFRLKGLEFLNELNGKNMSELRDDSIKAIIEDTHLYITKIKVTTPEFLKLQIFARVNKQGSALNAQEMRHALHQGAVTTLLLELSESIDIGIKKSRMKDRYLMLRYITMRLYFIGNLYNYKTEKEVEYTNIDDYLAEGMEAINSFTQNQIYELHEDFVKVYNRAIKIFGKKSFRLKEGTPINMIIFESTLLLVSLLFSKNDSEIRDIYYEFISIDEEPRTDEEDIDSETSFEKNIKYHRDSKENFLKRIEWVKEIIK